MRSHCTILSLLFSLWLLPTLYAQQEGGLTARVDFNAEVRPILADKCFACHGPDKNKREADLRLDTELGLKGNSEQIGVIVPNDPGNSKLIQRIEASDPGERMPPADFGKELDPAERALLRKWIEQGAMWSGHWAFQPIGSSSSRSVAAKSPSIDPADRWGRTEIDIHVANGMTLHGLKPSPVQSPRVLARRLSFDLLGLPPDPKRVDQFEADPSLANYEAMVDEWIASSQFGERLAVWWLDLVRYADSVGYHGDQPVKVSPFRDYVIRSFNENKRFDQFTIEQLAGDLLPEPSTEQWVASGYNRLGMMSAEGGAQAKEYLSKYASERVRNLSGAWLGVTIGCCECHDHKYDPFTTREFYQLEAFFADIQEQGVYDAGRKSEPWGPELQLPSPDQRAQQQQLMAQIEAVRKRIEASTEPPIEGQDAELAKLQSALDQLNGQIPTTLVTKRVEPRVVRILARGNWMDESGDVVQPGTPAALGALPSTDKRLTRLELARWVVAPENPLTARTTVNRLWKLFFGAGLSRKLDDLGAQGEPPTHPGLLDALASELIRSGWDIKHLVKQIVMSEAYRQSSGVSREVMERDPYNRWLSHQSRWRLDAEFVRDNALAVSELLRGNIGGESVRPYQPPLYWAYLNFPTREWQNGTGAELYRRSLYTHWQRQYLHPSLMAFDAPGREECTADRTRSNTPLQALVLLNDPIFVEASRVFAQRILEQPSSPDPNRIEWAIAQSLGRPARASEVALLESLLQKHRRELVADQASVESLLRVGETIVPSHLDRTELAAWTSVARALFNLHECITRN